MAFSIRINDIFSRVRLRVFSLERNELKRARTST